MGNNNRITGIPIIRNNDKEKALGIDSIVIYSFMDLYELKIIGEIKGKRILHPFHFICAVYDTDGDIVASKENNYYGSSVVTNTIEPAVYFDGFPFSFSVAIPDKTKISKIRIEPKQV